MTSFAKATYLVVMAGDGIVADRLWFEPVSVLETAGM